MSISTKEHGSVMSKLFKTWSNKKQSETKPLDMRIPYNQNKMKKVYLRMHDSKVTNMFPFANDTGLSTR